QWGTTTEAPAALGEFDLAASIGIRDGAKLQWTSQRAGVEYHAAAVPLHYATWTYVSALPTMTFEAAARDFLRSAGLAAVVALLLAGLTVTALARRMAKQANRVAHVAQQIVEHDLPTFVATARA